MNMILFEKISWKEAYLKIFEKISNTSSKKIAGITGDMIKKCYLTN